MVGFNPLGGSPLADLPNVAVPVTTPVSCLAATTPEDRFTISTAPILRSAVSVVKTGLSRIGKSIPQAAQTVSAAVDRNIRSILALTVPADSLIMRVSRATQNAVSPVSLVSTAKAFMSRAQNTATVVSSTTRATVTSARSTVSALAQSAAGSVRNRLLTSTSGPISAARAANQYTRAISALVTAGRTVLLFVAQRSLVSSTPVKSFRMTISDRAQAATQPAKSAVLAISERIQTVAQTIRSFSSAISTRLITAAPLVKSLSVSIADRITATVMPTSVSRASSLRAQTVVSTSTPLVSAKSISARLRSITTEAASITRAMMLSPRQLFASGTSVSSMRSSTARNIFASLVGATSMRFSFTRMMAVFPGSVAAVRSTTARILAASSASVTSLKLLFARMLATSSGGIASNKSITARYRVILVSAPVISALVRSSTDKAAATTTPSSIVTRKMARTLVYDLVAAATSSLVTRYVRTISGMTTGVASWRAITARRINLMVATAVASRENKTNIRRISATALIDEPPMLDLMGLPIGGSKGATLTRQYLKGVRILVSSSSQVTETIALLRSFFISSTPLPTMRRTTLASIVATGSSMVDTAKANTVMFKTAVTSVVTVIRNIPRLLVSAAVTMMSSKVVVNACQNTAATPYSIGKGLAQKLIPAFAPTQQSVRVSAATTMIATVTVVTRLSRLLSARLRAVASPVGRRVISINQSIRGVLSATATKRAIVSISRRSITAPLVTALRAISYRLRGAVVSAKTMSASIYKPVRTTVVLAPITRAVAAPLLRAVVIGAASFDRLSQHFFLTVINAYPAISEEDQHRINAEAFGVGSEHRAIRQRIDHTASVMAVQLSAITNQLHSTASVAADRVSSTLTKGLVSAPVSATRALINALSGRASAITAKSVAHHDEKSLTVDAAIVTETHKAIDQTILAANNPALVLQHETAITHRADSTIESTIAGGHEHVLSLFSETLGRARIRARKAVLAFADSATETLFDLVPAFRPRTHGGGFPRPAVDWTRARPKPKAPPRDEITISIRLNGRADVKRYPVNDAVIKIGINIQKTVARILVRITRLFKQEPQNPTVRIRDDRD